MDRVRLAGSLAGRQRGSETGADSVALASPVRPRLPFFFDFYTLHHPVDNLTCSIHRNARLVGEASFIPAPPDAAFQSFSPTSENAAGLAPLSYHGAFEKKRQERAAQHCTLGAAPTDQHGRRAPAKPVHAVLHAPQKVAGEQVGAVDARCSDSYKQL